MVIIRLLAPWSKKISARDSYAIMISSSSINQVLLLIVAVFDLLLVNLVRDAGVGVVLDFSLSLSLSLSLIWVFVYLYA